MTFIKLLQTTGLSLIATAMLLTAPLASASLFDVSVNGGEAGQGDVTKEQCAELDESLARSLGCDTIDKVVDFTQYTGGLEGPDSAAYDPALTQNSSAREFIQTIVNFALSFLGLISVLMVIYGGFLYVLSRGDEEMSGKGKKTIGYAAMGILIILGSFALVNTLISAGGGGGAGGGGATNTVGGIASITDAGASFDVKAVLNEVEAVSADYLQTYEEYLYVSQEIAFLRALEMPFSVDVEDTDATLGGVIEFGLEFLSGQDKELTDRYTLLDENRVDVYIDDLREGIQKIQRGTDTLSDSYEQAQFLYDYLRSGSLSGQAPLLEQLFPSAHAVSAKDEFDDERSVFNALYGGETLTAGKGCGEVSYNTYAGYDALGLLGMNVFETKVSYIDDNVCGLLANVQVGANEDYNRKVGALVTRMGILEQLFESDDEAGVRSELIAIKALFMSANASLEQTKTFGNVNANYTRAVLEAMNKIYVAVQNLDFVSVQMSASTTRGNAPLIVRFDALNTVDPSGLTVTDEQIKWDLDGDGDFDDGQGAAVSTTYTKPGTYRARVRILSAQANIAAGLAIMNIVVEPAKSMIVLTANETNVIADFKVDASCKGFPVIDQNAFKVTKAEAKAGIRFDASETVDGQCNPRGIVYAEWDFGDNEIVSGSWTNADIRQPVHAYGKEGTYQVSFTVTDETGEVDQKYFTLYVASPAARIQHFPASGVVGTEFSFDGGGSTADVGTIVNYEWQALRVGTAGTTPFPLANTSGTNMTTDFGRPGLYQVSLRVTDSGGAPDTTTVEVLVESQAPVATYEYFVPASNEPAITHFDASDSYDPDDEDEITYEWDFDGVLGQDYEVIEEINGGEEMIVEFLSVGTRDVTLTVSDQHTPPIQKSSSFIREVNVNSLLDISMEVADQNARHLDGDGKSEVEVTAFSDNATGFEIDYGDGVTDFTEEITRGQSTLTHLYEESGVFYITLTAYDDRDESNSISQRVFVGSGDAPISVIDVTSEREDVGSAPTFTGNVNTQFKFDAGRSVNVDGSTSDLQYSWNFGDGVTSNQKTVTHRYDEKALFTVTLTVKDRNDPSVQAASTIKVQVNAIAPKIRQVSVAPIGASIETPLRVTLTVDAVDEDGDISFYKAWYYDVSDTAEELGTVISQTGSITMTVNTNGKTGDEVEYEFAVEVTDDDNQTVSSRDSLSADQQARLEVVNGPNENPVASFSVDRSSIFIGEGITFTSSSYDSDGDIVSYTWDIGNDGFYNDIPQDEATLERVFTDFHPEGVEVRLRVEDDAGATGTSDVTIVYVDAISDPPEAAFLTDVEGFTVTFTDNSTIDTLNGAELQGIYWDFDTTTDSNGNGIPDDDFDSFEEITSHSYPALGAYTVKLTVVDSTGQVDSVTRGIQVVEAFQPSSEFTNRVDDLKVWFTDESVVDSAAGASIRSYEWDFDLDEDVDEDGDPTNDKESIQDSPSHVYSEYGKYTVQLTITDSLGQADTSVQEVTVLGPIEFVDAILSSVPQPNDRGQIVLPRSPGDVTYYFSGDHGSGNFSYSIDGNIFFDSDGDGNRENDVDFFSDESGSWRTSYLSSYGQIVSKLTVTDLETGDSDIATLQVVFSGVLGAASLFNASPSEMIFLIVSSMLMAILGVTTFFRFTILSPR